MAKIPSRKFLNSNKKIVGTKFPKGKRKIASRKLGIKMTKIVSRTTSDVSAESKIIPEDPEILGLSIDKESRPGRLAALLKQSRSLKPASELPKKGTKPSYSEEF